MPKIQLVRNVPKEVRKIDAAALDVISVTRVVRSGLSYDLVCATCHEVIRGDVRTDRSPLYNRERIAAHLAVCSGRRKRWWERVRGRVLRAG
jgi:hypothetical protein